MASFVESSFGLTSYLSSHDGFSGILKMRYQDFLVNEIDSDQIVLYLNSLVYNEPEQNKDPDLSKVRSRWAYCY